MRTDKLTSKFQLALQDAQSVALGKDHQYIEPVHLMIALLDQEGGSARGLLTQTGANVNLLRSQLGEALDRMSSVSGGDAGDVMISNDLSKLLNVTDKLAQKRNDQYISSELFILAAIDDKGALGIALKNNGATKASLEQAIESMRGGASVDDPNAEDQREALIKYSIDLTERPDLG
jgi:ATP-dependent Clp protease ATP-binding subunit ClpB